MTLKNIPISDLNGFRIGHSQNELAGTGCSVVISDTGAVAGVDVRGGAPGTRETDLLRSENLLDKVHGIFLAGGSAYGLNTASGVMQFLEEKGIGFDVQVAKVPIVPGAILFDLMVGESIVRPDKEMGYQACINAFKETENQSGNIGAGTGASVGKLLGPTYAMKGGVGTYAVQIGDLQVGAMIAVNSFGDIFDSKYGKTIAGVYDRDNHKFLSTEDLLIEQMSELKTNRFPGNTSIGVLMTNAKWDKSQANKIASISHDGFARSMRPSHTLVDGDTIFTMSTNQVAVDLNGLASVAVHVVEKAVVEAIKHADPAYGLVAYKNISNS